MRRSCLPFTILGILLMVCSVFFAVNAQEEKPVLSVVRAEGKNLLKNADFSELAGDKLQQWEPYEGGFQLASGAGRDGKNAVLLERKAGDPARGVLQVIELNQQVPLPITISGWSKTESMTGTSDVDYSLYADLTYQDGSNLWGQIGTFKVGTHDWQNQQYAIAPSQPVKSINFYALLRGQHYGKAWFSDLKVSVLADDKIATFDTVPVRIAPPSTPDGKGTNYQTGDGLALNYSSADGRLRALKIGRRDLFKTAPFSGFLVRDVAAGSDYYGFKNGRSTKLGLTLDTKIVSAADHIAIEGRIADTTGKDRALTLVFALPIEGTGWQWDSDTQRSQPIDKRGEYNTTVPFDAGSNGQISQYPFANIHNGDNGLALGIDMNQPAQFRLSYNATTHHYFIAYDFGLVPETQPAGTANFRFILYRTDPQWGFRSATAKLYKIFPEMFRVRDDVKPEGLWMPFGDIRNVQGWQDFGFRVRETGEQGFKDGSLKFEDENGIRTFRYSEMMTWWMSMLPEMPRTYEAAVAEMQRIAADPKHPAHAQAQTVLTSGFRDAEGKFLLSFHNQPWANGAVWSLNPDPDLPGEFTEANTKWSPAIQQRVYGNTANGVMDGEYLDSLEGYVTANLDFSREHFRVAKIPLTYSLNDYQPAQHKAFLVYEFARRMSQDLHRIDKLVMANAVPYRFGFLMPWFDIAGTETNWNIEGKWTPASDSTMSLWRTLSGAKPYLLLQNTDFRDFSHEMAERYMQKSLAFGFFPSFFSADAATAVYWDNPTLYNRDRDLFKKYVPVVRTIAEAGWQPLTEARSDNPEIRLERFGAPGKGHYLTARNGTEQAQTTVVKLPASWKTKSVTDLLSGQVVPLNDGKATLTLPAWSATALEIR